MIIVFVLFLALPLVWVLGGFLVSFSFLSLVVCLASFLVLLLLVGVCLALFLVLDPFLFLFYFLFTIKHVSL